MYLSARNKIEKQNIQLAAENTEKQKLIKKLEEEDQIIRLYESGIQHDWKNYLVSIQKGLIV
jgi:hypothetical protein